MRKNGKRIFVLCTHRSVREIMVASLLATHSHNEWDIWIAPGIFAAEDVTLVRRTLDEIHIPLFLPHTIEPSPACSWDEGIVLCSGATDQ